MFVLYKKEADGYVYTDVWLSEDGQCGFEHIGKLGTIGQTQEFDFSKNPNLDGSAWADMKEKHYRDQGYDEVDEGDLSVVVLQFPVSSELVNSLENADDEQQEEILNKIDNHPDYDALSFGLTKLSLDNGFFPGFDGFDLGYNGEDKPVINIYSYGLDGASYATLIQSYLVNEKHFTLDQFTLAYANANDEEEDDKFTVLNGTSSQFSI